MRWRLEGQGGPEASTRIEWGPLDESACSHARSFLAYGEARPVALSEMASQRGIERRRLARGGLLVSGTRSARHYEGKRDDRLTSRSDFSTQFEEESYALQELDYFRYRREAWETGWRYLQNRHRTKRGKNKCFVLQSPLVLCGDNTRRIFERRG